MTQGLFRMKVQETKSLWEALGPGRQRAFSSANHWGARPCGALFLTQEVPQWENSSSFTNSSSHKVNMTSRSIHKNKGGQERASGAQDQDFNPVPPLAM